MADDLMEIKNLGHAETIAHSLQKLWSNGKMCDLALVVGGSMFKVHKVVLVSQSKYFENLLLESSEILVELKEIDPECLQKILRYLYYGTVTVSMKDIEGIVKLADYFQIDELKMHCTECPRGRLTSKIKLSQNQPKKCLQEE